VVDEGVESGKEYSYALVTVESDGSRELVGEKRVKLSGVSTSGYSLSVAPNPLRESGELVIRVAAETEATIRLYNATGQQVKEIGKRLLAVGENRIHLDVSKLPGGVYTVEVTAAAGIVSTGSMTVQR
jgi:hypothetical protein